MKVLFVIDAIKDLKSKAETITKHLGDDIAFIVKAPLVSLVETFGYKADAVYFNNLTRVMHEYMVHQPLQDTIVYYSSLNITDQLLTNFIQIIGNRDKIVNVKPHYNLFEQLGNQLYNVFVQSMFKLKDSFASPKLQFLPKPFMRQLLSSHFGNKLFEYDERFVRNLNIKDKGTCKDLKVKTKFNKYNLVAIIAALLITIGLIVTLAFNKMNFFVVLLFVMLYAINIFITFIINYKEKFDARFLK